MPSVNLGRVSPIPKGQWDSSTTYEKLDVVTNGGSSYIANQNVPIGTSLSTTEYWTKLVGGLTIGTVETVSYENGASANIVTTSTNDQILNLEIPQGINGNETIDDSKGENDTDYVWSADKNYKENEKIKSMLSGIETSMTTTTNYNKGDLVVVNSKLYRFTQNVSSGNSITVGNNVIETTIKNELALKTNSSDLGTLASKNDVSSNDKIYGRKNGDWEEVAIEWGNISGDIVDQTDLQSALDAKADAIQRTTSGAVVSFSDGADGMPVTALSMGIEPVQDLHGQDAPYPAGGGKNLLPTTFPSNTINASIGSSGVTTATNARTFSLPCKANTNYTISDDDTVSWNIGFSTKMAEVGDDTTTFTYKGSMQNRSTWTINSEENTWMVITFITEELFYTHEEKKCMIEEGSSATSFAPYSNICPINGWTGATVYDTGKNLYNKNGDLTDKGYYLNKTDGTQANSSNWYICYIPVKPGQTYSISGLTTGGTSIGHWWMNGSKQPLSLIGGRSTIPIQGVTAPAEAVYMALSLVWNGDSSDLNTCQIEFGSTATAYEPYQGTSVTMAFGQTVYGGTLKVLTGILTVDRAIMLISGLTWTATSSSGRDFFRTSNLDYIKSGSSCLTSNIPFVGNTSVGNMPDGSLALIGTQFRLYDTSLTDSASLVTKYGTGQIVYELATPITYTLTAQQMSTLLGDNNIWADTGNVNVTYKADTKMYIDNAIAQSMRNTRKMIAGEEKEMKATQNYTIGEYLWVGDDLYKVTANISNSNNITIGTNVQKCTIGEQLKLALS